MTYYDPINKVVKQDNGRVIYANGFGGITTVEPHRGIATDDLAKARAEIQRADAAAHNWKR